MFLHQLALCLGRTVSELRASMSVDELANWMAYSRIHPINPDRMDYMLAQLTATVCQVAGAKKSGGGHFKMDDFMLFKYVPPKTPKQLMTQLFGHMVTRKPH